MRGYNAEDLTKYSGQFHAQADKVADLGSALRSSVTDPAQRRTVDDFPQAFTEMRNKNETALSAFEKASGQNPRDVDMMVKGQDRSSTDLLDRVVDGMVAQANAAVASEKEAVARTIRWAAVSVLVLFAAIGIAVTFIIGDLSGTLRRAVRDLTEDAGLRLTNPSKQWSRP